MLRFDAEQRAILRGSFEAHAKGQKRPPLLSPELGAVLMAWDALGTPCTVLTGLSSAVVDERGRLVPGRFEYLREFVVRDDWDIWMRLWGGLDRDFIAHRQEQLSKATKETQKK